MFRKYLLIFFLFMSQVVISQKAYITMETRDILTYPYSDPDPIPILVERMYEIYPYHAFSGYALKGQLQKWNVVKLENDYVEVYILPTNGGKVWGAIEKSTGKEFIYRNEVMKFRNISMRGPWTSGGIEFNFGFIGHHPSTCVPVDYKTVENSDGSVSCIVGNLDLPSRTKWNVEVRLPKDKAYFETFATWNNPTPLPQTYYNWMTAAAVVTDDLEFSYPGNGEIGHGGEYGLWPVNENGRNVAWYKENNFESSKSYHVVGEFNDFMGGYYHNSKFGFGHWALYDEMPGHKLWLWSLARDGGIWEDLLTDTDGQYMEFQAGRMFNQYGGTSAFKTPISQTPFYPGLTDQWHEIWFPVKEIGGLTDVSPMGVMHVESENGKLRIGINALAFTQGKLVVRSEGKIVFTEEKKFKPMDVYTTQVTLNTNSDYEVVVEGMELQYSPSKRQLLKRPFVSDMPKDIITAASLYQEGMELKEQRNYPDAEDFLKKCLQKDPLYIDAYAALTELFYRSLRYDSALYYADRALQLDTYHPAVNYFAGITYLANGDLTDALESLGWAARSPEYRSTAYAQMAAIEFKMNNKSLTEHYASLSLDFNRTNINALQILAVLYRKSGETAKADNYIETISSIDKLSHFADFERNLLHPSDENRTRFTSTITNEMSYQTYLELCMQYYGLGLKNDALAVLEKAPVHPLITLWKAYLKEDASMLNEVAVASPAYVFPYRTETVSALKWAILKNDNWKFKYYLALNYAAIQRKQDAMKLFRECGQEPDFAPFYLTRASLLASEGEKQVLDDLLRAQKLSPDDWRTAVKLIDYYESQKDDQTALSVATNAYKKQKDNSILGIRYAIALMNTGQYIACLKTLEGMNILPNEGASQGKEVFEQAALFLSVDLIKKKKYREAIKMIEKSKEWPENLGVGKPYVVDTRLQDYLNILCLNKLNRKVETEGLKKSILDYTNQHTGPSVNNLLAINLLKEKGDANAVNTMIQKLENSSSTIQQWVIAKSKNDTDAANRLEKNLTDIKYFQIIKALEKITNL